jgi:hypothetical protein
VPHESLVSEDGEDGPSGSRYTVGAVFCSHCVRTAATWEHGNATQAEMLTAFRVWCIRYQLKPWTAKQLAQAITCTAGPRRPPRRSPHRVSRANGCRRSNRRVGSVVCCLSDVDSQRETAMSVKLPMKKGTLDQVFS